MTLELRPPGVACQLACTYCYQEPMRKAGNINAKYDIDKMLAVVDEVGHDFTLFGGEALLTKMSDLDRLWSYGFEKFGRNGIQTNGELINDQHIEMFLKYNVNVGISIDGPGELNSLRQVRKDRSNEATRKSTDKIVQNIEKVAKAGCKIGLIITLHRENASTERLPKLLEFIEWLGTIGVSQGNIHVLEVDATMPDQEIHVLSQEENIHAMLSLAKFFKERPELQWAPFREMHNILDGDDSHATCYWKNCDHGDTQAVYGVEGDGALTNCGRTNKEGIDWYKANQRTYARYIGFYYTPDEMGGCQGCRFWMACGGSCPGESENGDFRNKTIHCETQRALLTFYEEELEAQGKVPITKSEYREEIEQIMLHNLRLGEPITIGKSLYVIKKRREQAQPDDAIVVEVKPGPRKEQ